MRPTTNSNYYPKSKIIGIFNQILQQSQQFIYRGPRPKKYGRNIPTEIKQVQRISLKVKSEKN